MTPATSPLEAFLIHMGPFTWDDLVTGYDFGLLTAQEIQVEAPGVGLAVQRLRALSGSGLFTFEAHLWAACVEAVGKTPRPGSSRWALAQDRWRAALLRETLTMEKTSAQLARAVERVYEQVGCPEDMLAMLKPSPPWSGEPAILDPSAMQKFLDGNGFIKPRRFGTAP
ncbi:MAG TPA: hypothetical protein VJ486_06220 [Geothrix sp.]|nr:hypothetical protein [Geothrix sp.]